MLQPEADIIAAGHFAPHERFSLTFFVAPPQTDGGFHTVQGVRKPSFTKANGKKPPFFHPGILPGRKNNAASKGCTHKALSGIGAWTNERPASE
jgi:hypothetical protein